MPHDERRIHDHLHELVRDSVELLINAMMDAQADLLCRARRYERSPERTDTRAGYYRRKLHSNSGVVMLKVPRLRRAPLDTTIVEHYRRREKWVEDALIETYLTAAATGPLEEIIRALGGPWVPPDLVSKLKRKVHWQIEASRERRLEGRYVCAYLDGYSWDSPRAAKCKIGPSSLRSAWTGADQGRFSASLRATGRITRLGARC